MDSIMQLYYSGCFLDVNYHDPPEKIKKGVGGKG